MADNSLFLKVKLTEELFEIIDELFKFANTYYESFLFELDENIQRQERIKEEHSILFYPHLYWWAVFCAPLDNDNKTIFDQYLHKFLPRIKGKKAVLHTILQWRNVYPSFYLYVHSFGDRVLIVKDLIDHTFKVVSIHNKDYHMPVQNEVLTGLILPFGNGTYCTIIDFLHMPANITIEADASLMIFHPSIQASSYPQYLKRNYPKFLAHRLQTGVQAQ